MHRDLRQHLYHSYCADDHDDDCLCKLVWYYVVAVQAALTTTTSTTKTTIAKTTVTSLLQSSGLNDCPTDTTPYEDLASSRMGMGRTTRAVALVFNSAAVISVRSGSRVERGRSCRL